MQTKLTQVKETLVSEKINIVDEKSKETEKVKAFAEKNFAKAIPIILEIFERSVNAETPENE